MSRTLDANQQAAVAASHVTAARLVQMEFTSGSIYLTDAGRNIEWNGQTWLAGRINLESIREAVTGESTGVAGSIAGSISSYLSVALSEFVQGKPVRVYVAFFDASENLVGTPVEEGYWLADTMNVEDAPDGISVIRVTGESRYAQFARPRVRRHNDADQQAAFAGDVFYQFAPGLVDKSIVFPSREWFRVNT